VTAGLPPYSGSFSVSSTSLTVGTLVTLTLSDWMAYGTQWPLDFAFGYSFRDALSETVQLVEYSSRTSRTVLLPAGTRRNTVCRRRHALISTQATSRCTATCAIRCPS
jgi:hypothetical protein